MNWLELICSGLFLTFSFYISLKTTLWKCIIWTLLLLTTGNLRRTKDYPEKQKSQSTYNCFQSRLASLRFSINCNYRLKMHLFGNIEITEIKGDSIISSTAVKNFQLSFLSIVTYDRNQVEPLECRWSISSIAAVNCPAFAPWTMTDNRSFELMNSKTDGFISIQGA